MKIGVNTLLWTAHFDREHFPLFDRVKAHGFDAIEMARFDWTGFPGAEVRRELQRAGLDAILCTALTAQRSLVTPDDAARQEALAFLRQSIEAASECGSRLLVGPFVSPVGYLTGRRRTDEEWKRGVAGLQSLVPLLEKLDIRLAVEPLNRFETYILNTAADARKLCDEVGSEKVCVLYDTFHGNIEEKSHAEALAAIGPRLAHVHACENDRGIPGSGHVAWDEVFSSLRASGYDGYLVIESFGFAIKEIAAAACIWRDLAPSPDAIAWEGGKFLRSRLAESTV